MATLTGGYTWSMALAAILPLLHVVDTARRATEVNADLMLVALIAFLAVAGALWWPVLVRAFRRPVRRFGPTLVAVAVVAAILPSVVPYDHLVPVGDGHATEAHASHCHVTPSSCADAPVSAGPGQFVFSEPLIVVPAFVLTLFAVASLALAGQTPRPAIRPPLAAFA